MHPDVANTLQVCLTSVIKIGAPVDMVCFECYILFLPIGEDSWTLYPIECVDESQIDEQVLCTADYDPVCGCDDITHYLYITTLNNSTITNIILMFEITL
jgi:hypothetical protein